MKVAKADPVIRGMLEEEQRRSRDILQALQSKADNLPKGALNVRRKQVQGKEYLYHYLVRREGKKVVNRHVPERDLPGITAGATLFVYPSLYEGFGLPLGQAMAAGIPAVTSNVSSMPEVVGDAGLLVDPRSPAEIRGAMERLLESRDLRDALASRARLRARRYRWEVCARQSLEYFRKLAG